MQSTVIPRAIHAKLGEQRGIARELHQHLEQKTIALGQLLRRGFTGSAGGTTSIFYGRKKWHSALFTASGPAGHLGLGIPGAAS